MLIINQLIRSQGGSGSAGRMNSTLGGNEQKSLESLKVSNIDLEKTVLDIFDKTDGPVDPQNIEACHRLKSDDNGGSNKVIVKFSKRKGMVRTMNKKKSLKMLTQMLQVFPQAFYYSLILVFAGTTSSCGLNVKHYGRVN